MSIHLHRVIAHNPTLGPCTPRRVCIYELCMLSTSRRADGGRPHLTERGRPCSMHTTLAQGRGRSVTQASAGCAAAVPSFRPRGLTRARMARRATAHPRLRSCPSFPPRPVTSLAPGRRGLLPWPPPQRNPHRPKKHRPRSAAPRCRQCPFCRRESRA